MTKLLIGNTGTLGLTLKSQADFEFTCNSSNLNSMLRKRFDLVVVAAPRAEKWRANKYPNEDKTHVLALMDRLNHLKTKKLVLLGTVDIFANPMGVDETVKPVRAGLKPYGEHRLMLENYLRERFDTTVLRLSGLVGQFIKKNYLFDLKNGSRLEDVSYEDELQFYDCSKLWLDINWALNMSVKTLHLASTPVKIGEVVNRFFGYQLSKELSPNQKYDVQSIYQVNGLYRHTVAEIYEVLQAYFQHD
jgi:hypothetical protein